MPQWLPYMTTCHHICYKRCPQFLADHLKMLVPWKKKKISNIHGKWQQSQLFFEIHVTNFNIALFHLTNLNHFSWNSQWLLLQSLISKFLRTHQSLLTILVMEKKQLKKSLITFCLEGFFLRVPQKKTGTAGVR